MRRTVKCHLPGKAVICPGLVCNWTPAIYHRKVAHEALPFLLNYWLPIRFSERGIIILSPELTDELTKLMGSFKPTVTQTALVKISGP